MAWDDPLTEADIEGILFCKDGDKRFRICYMTYAWARRGLEEICILIRFSSSFSEVGGDSSARGLEAASPPPCRSSSLSSLAPPVTTLYIIVYRTEPSKKIYTKPKMNSLFIQDCSLLYCLYRMQLIWFQGRFKLTYPNYNRCFLVKREYEWYIIYAWNLV